MVSFEWIVAVWRLRKGCNSKGKTTMKTFTSLINEPTTTTAMKIAKARNLLKPTVKFPSISNFPSGWGDEVEAINRLNQWLEVAQNIVNLNYAQFPELEPSILEMSDGRRYIRVDTIMDNGRGQRSGWAFIDKQTGDVLQPSTYRNPAKHARGNLLDEYRGVEMLTPHGPASLG